MFDMIQSLDWLVLDWLRNVFSCPFLDTVMPFVTRLGSAGALWIISGLTMLCTDKYRRYGVLMLFSLAAGLILGNAVIKSIVSRPRPYQLSDSTVILIGEPMGSSFPSGHALSSAIGASTLTKANRRFALFAVPAAVLIAFSRLYLYVHFPSDVVCGALIGLVTAFAVNRLYEMVQGRKRKRKA